MKVVIDISAKDFNAIRQGGLYFFGHDRLDQCITEAFQICTIIPKGHGDLIDRDNLINLCKNYTNEDAIGLILARREDYLPTLVEADKENDDD